MGSNSIPASFDLWTLIPLFDFFDFLPASVRGGACTGTTVLFEAAAGVDKVFDSCSSKDSGGRRERGDGRELSQGERAP